MGKPRRLSRACVLVAVIALAAPAGAVSHHRRTPNAISSSRRDHGHRGHDEPPPIPTHNEVGVQVPDAVPALSWASVPSPYSEEMQKLVSKGDMGAKEAIAKWPSWREWKAKYRNTSYPSVQTEIYAFHAFLENDMVIQAHNGDHTNSYYSLGHSEWSAHSFHEFENLMFPVKAADIMPPSYASLGEHVDKKPNGQLMDIPTSVDWSSKNVVSPVTNQGECGSSWAFASVSAIESLCAVEGKTLSAAGALPLSPQELVSCDVGTLEAPYADDGCDGGLAQNAFGYAASTGGLCTATEYPYASGNGHSYPCVHCTKTMQISGWKSVRAGDETALMHAVSQHPVAVAIQANSMQLQLYKSGVFDSPSCGKEPDHAVLLVGYGTTSTNVPYWKLKNSWGDTWGDGGYFYLKRGVNQCGITAMASYPFNCSAVNGGDPRGKPPVPAPKESDCPAPRNGDIKLTSYPAGNLLINFEGAWHPLCSQHLEIETAELMCQALGYTTAWSFSDRTLPSDHAGPMFPSLHCDTDYDVDEAGGANILNMCSFKGAHTSDWLCELFGPAMAAYLVCHGTTPPREVLTCGTAGWPNRNLAHYGRAEEAAEQLREQYRARAQAGGTGSADGLSAAAPVSSSGLASMAGVGLAVAVLVVGALALATRVARPSKRDSTMETPATQQQF